MKKTLLALSLIGCFSSLAFAESQVTLYGSVDDGIVVQKNSGAAAQVMLKPDMHGASFWGLRGAEELGGGTKIGFVLEQGFLSDDGTLSATTYTTTSGFTRKSLLTAEGPWGYLGAGRTDSLSFAPDLLSGWIVVTGVSMTAWQNLGTTLNRINNTITYQTPDMNGFKVRLMYGNGIGNDTEQWSHNTHYYGLGLFYKAHDVKSMLIYENVDWKGVGFKTDGDKAALKTKGDQNLVNFGIEYNLGNWTPMFAYQWANKVNGVQTHMFGLSAKVDAGGGQFLIGARYIFGKDTSLNKPTSGKGLTDLKTNHLGAWNIDLGYIYPLSKRTSLKALAAYTKSQKAWLNEAFTSRNDTKMINNGYQLYAGMTHKF